MFFRKGKRLFVLGFCPVVLAVVVFLTACFGPVARAAGSLDTGVAAPRVDSPSCVVMDAISGQVLFEKDSKTRRAPASLTKIMTLVLALEDVAAGKVSLTDEAVASENAWEMGGTEVWAEPGESMPLDEWLKAIAVGSANDGSVVVAEFLSGSVESFAERMNQRARELGMNDTHFVNPHGLDADGHETTAMDMAILSRHAVTVPHLLDYTKIYQTEFRGGKNLLTNFNKLVYLYPGADGLKTGMTDKSGYCISATAQRDGSRFIVVLMGAATPDQRLNDAWRLLDWAFANFRSLEILKKDETVCQARVWKGRTETVEVVPKESLAVTLTKGQKGETRRLINLERVVAPVKKGDVVGEISIELDGRVISKIPLIARNDVERANFWDYALKYLRAFMVGR
ncbi:MAG TPA: D-alanyl-D-alanine carboxypeptidase [Firmicutes bacterium]|nr:D-alanyl-D-alanine carboxypeptidase [Candidatus Fermentithermobacillaceae bacterium]